MKKIYENKKGVVHIGGNEIDKATLETLRDEALILEKTLLWEIICSTIENEAYDIALKQSTNWEHVLSAKQLHHWLFVTKNIVHQLAHKVDNNKA